MMPWPCPTACLVDTHEADTRDTRGGQCLEARPKRGDTRRTHGGQSAEMSKHIAASPFSSKREPLTPHYTSIDPKKFFKQRGRLQRLNLGGKLNAKETDQRARNINAVGCVVVGKNFTWWWPRVDKVLADKVWRPAKADSKRTPGETQGGHKPDKV